MLTSRSLAALFGAVYLVMGVVGLVFVRGEGEIFGVFPTSGLSAVVSLLAGFVLLYAAQKLESAREAGLIVGGIVLALGVLALLAPNLWGAMHMHGPSCYLNVALGAILVLAALATPRAGEAYDLEDRQRVRAG
ncbi:MAG TPA: DUF4383 domain-containing protein [Deinococcales bacterium]|nr:DUF4383 domain-containing protein [Deinococcales bacterium]